MQTPPSSQSNGGVLPRNEWIRHPNDTTAVPYGMCILIEGKYFFEIDMARLRQHSIALNDIFSIPSGLATDGTKENPVAIPYISGEEFSHFVNWFNTQPWSLDRPSKVALLSILAICHRFMMDTGIEWSIHCLDSLVEDALTPSHRLQLAFRYKIEKWVLHAVNDIFDRQGRKQLRSLTTEDIEQLGLHAFIFIAKGVETVLGSRSSVGLSVPTAYHSPQCRVSNQRERDCTHAWHAFWYAVVRQLMQDADHPMPLQDLPAFLRRTEVKGVEEACKSLNLFHFEKASILSVEPSVRKHVASGIWDLYQQGYT